MFQHALVLSFPLEEGLASNEKAAGIIKGPPKEKWKLTTAGGRGGWSSLFNEGSCGLDFIFFLSGKWGGVCSTKETPGGVFSETVLDRNRGISSFPNFGTVSIENILWNLLRAKFEQEYVQSYLW